MATLSLAGNAAAGAPATPDRVGDGHGAPDVCAVALSTSPSSVTFAIAFADRPSLKAGERVSLLLNDDRNAATGSTQLRGADVLMSYGIQGDRTFAGEALRWQRTRWALAAQGKQAVRFVPGKGMLRVVVPRNLLRGAAFDWAVVTFQAGSGRGSDAVPDSHMAHHTAAATGTAATPSCGPAAHPA